MTIVYITGGGDYHHARPDCPGITGGQKTADVHSWTAHPVEEVPLSEARQRGKAEACTKCRGAS